jgi:hypothetical protein
MTAKLAMLGQELDLPLLEHIIVAAGKVGRVPIYR